MAHKKNTTNLTELLLQCVTRSSRLGLLHYAVMRMQYIYIEEKVQRFAKQQKRGYPEFCVTTKKRCKIELIFQGGSGVGCARLVYNITPTKAEVKGHPRPLEPRRRRSAP